jgi:hypothetical protein
MTDSGNFMAGLELLSELSKPDGMPKDKTIEIVITCALPAVQYGPVGSGDDLKSKSGW